MEEIISNIYRIPVILPGNPLKELNSYLIRGNGRNFLIDTGFRQPACREALRAGLDELGVRQEETDILLTHMHSDHSGLAPEFVGAGKNIFLDRTDLALIQNIRLEKWTSADDRFIREGFPLDEVKQLVESNPARIFAPDPNCPHYSPVEAGNIFEAGQYKLTAVATPGHTPGHLCFWMEEQQIMFTGDHVLFDITPNITCWPNKPDSLGDYMESLKNIRAYDVKLSLPGHRLGGNFYQRIDELLSHHDYRIGEALRIVRELPGIDAYQVAAQMTWKIKSRSWDDFPIVQKSFAVAECLSHLDYLFVRGHIKRETLNDGVVRNYAM